MRWLVAFLLVIAPSCAALDRVVPIFDPASGEQIGETTVGDLAGASVESSAGAVSDTISSVVSGVSGNPALGGATGLGAMGLLLAAAAALKRKKGKA